jgi:hypothetical protein
MSLLDTKLEQIKIRIYPIILVAALSSLQVVADEPVFPWWNDAEPTDQPDAAAAASMPLKEGLSPNGEYQIKVIGSDPMDHSYAFGFLDKTGSMLFQVNFGSGFCVVQGASELDRALWNADSKLVAIEDHDTRHSMALHLLAIENGKAVKIVLPQFGKAMGPKIADIHGGAEGACGCEPLEWDGNLLTFRFYAGPYVSDVTMRVILSTPPRALLVSETPPKEGEISN